MGSFVSEAVKGLRAEVKAAPTLRHKVFTLVPGAITLVKELSTGIKLLPFGISSAYLYRSLPSLTDYLQQADTHNSTAAPVCNSKYGVLLQQQQAYGPGPRHKIDVYVPQHVGEQVRRGQDPKAPVAFFTHGGVWASGDSWHYSRLATRLAQSGCLVLVHTYTLFPDVLVPQGERFLFTPGESSSNKQRATGSKKKQQMIEEVSAALTWALENVHRYGGDPNAITAIGHSAGTHLLTLALMKRAGLPVGYSAWQAADQAQPNHDHSHAHTVNDSHTVHVNSVTSVTGKWAAPEPLPDVHSSLHDDRMPVSLVGLAGVFDILKHYEHEQSRGVASLSMMRRAMGESDVACAALSPSIVLNTVADILERNRSHDTATSSSSSNVYSKASRNDSSDGGNKDASNSSGSSSESTGVGIGVQQVADSPSPQIASAYAAGQLPSSCPSPGPGPNPSSRPPSYYQSFLLRGDAIAHRSGLLRPSHVMAHHHAPHHPHMPDLPYPHPHQYNDLNTWVVQATGGDSWGWDGVQNQPQQLQPEKLAAAVKKLPKIFLLSGCADHVVPWHESAEMVHALHRCQVPTRPLLYQHADHAAFIVDWYPLPANATEGQHTGPPSVEGLPDWSRDVLLLVTTLNCVAKQQQQQQQQGQGQQGGVHAGSKAQGAGSTVQQGPEVVTMFSKL